MLERDHKQVPGVIYKALGCDFLAHFLITGFYFIISVHKFMCHMPKGMTVLETLCRNELVMVVNKVVDKYQ